MSQIIYRKTSGFDKDLKKLIRKFRTLEDDIEIAKKNTIELFHLKNIDNNSIELIPNFCTDELKICKIRKFACKSLKGRGVQSGMRVIYSYNILNRIVDFIEIYFKGDSENEDRERISEYLDHVNL
jgi:mRNA-degrading endonuclease RelE of RelBE toxin-antitoxin system